MQPSLCSAYSKGFSKERPKIYMHSLNLFLSCTGFQKWSWQSDHWGNLWGLKNSRVYEPCPLERVYFTKAPSYCSEEEKLGNSIPSWEITPRRSKKFRESAREGKKRERLEYCHQRRLELETIQDVIMADIPVHNQKFLSIMWEKSLCIVSADAPVKK